MKNTDRAGSPCEKMTSPFLCLTCLRPSPTLARNAVGLNGDLLLAAIAPPFKVDFRRLKVAPPGFGANRAGKEIRLPPGDSIGNSALSDYSVTAARLVK